MLEGKSPDDEKMSVKEQHKAYTTVNLNEPFTEEQLLQKWAEFIATLDDRPNLKTTLSKTPVLKEDLTLLITLDNSVQDELVKNIKPQLVSWLRRELRNSGIDLITEIAEDIIEKRAYTDTEKFEEMIQKNPKLALLKQRFNLDFDS